MWRQGRNYLSFFVAFLYLHQIMPHFLSYFAAAHFHSFVVVHRSLKDVQVVIETQRSSSPRKYWLLTTLIALA